MDFRTYVLFGQKFVESAEEKYKVHDMDHIKWTFVMDSAIFCRWSIYCVRMTMMMKSQRLTFKYHLSLMNMSKMIKLIGYKNFLIIKCVNI